MDQYRGTTIISVRRNGKVVIALEGGYELDAISRSAEATLRALLK